MFQVCVKSLKMNRTILQDNNITKIFVDIQDCVRLYIRVDALRCHECSGSKHHDRCVCRPNPLVIHRWRPILEQSCTHVTEKRPCLIDMEWRSVSSQNYLLTRWRLNIWGSKNEWLADPLHGRRRNCPSFHLLLIFRHQNPWDVSTVFRSLDYQWGSRYDNTLFNVW